MNGHYERTSASECIHTHTENNTTNDRQYRIMRPMINIRRVIEMKLRNQLRNEGTKTLENRLIIRED